MQFEDVRFRATIAVFITLASVNHLIAWLAARGAPVHIFSLLTTIAVYFWFLTFGQSMSRARRATFNEHNLLLTYQPRALTHGHLFTPDPPTPAPTGSSAQSTNAAFGGCGGTTRSEFRAARDAHYRDEFNVVMRSSRDGCGGGGGPQAPPTRLEPAPVSMRIEFEECSSLSSSSEDSMPPSSSSSSTSSDAKTETRRR